jgi:hypothetical protein
MRTDGSTHVYSHSHVQFHASEEQLGEMVEGVLQTDTDTDTDTDNRHRTDTEPEPEAEREREGKADRQTDRDAERERERIHLTWTGRERRTLLTASRDERDLALLPLPQHPSRLPLPHYCRYHKSNKCNL